MTSLVNMLPLDKLMPRSAKVEGGMMELAMP